MFLTSADEMYGPITTLRCDNRLVKHIPWSAFKMADQDWLRVVDVRDILGVRSLILRSRIPTNQFIRIPIESSNISPLRSNRHCGVPFPLLKSFSQHGRRNQQYLNIPCTKMPLPMVLQSWASIIRGLMRSPALFWHLVRLELNHQTCIDDF